MRILFLSDNFPPEVNAPASRTFEHCREWARNGHEVTVITCAPNFPRGRVFNGYRNRLRQIEWMDGIRVVRVWSYISANEGVIRRSLDYVSFMVSATFAGVFGRRPDVVIGTSPQFFTVCAAYLVSRFRRRPFVFELRDLWPESIRVVGALQSQRMLSWLARIESFLYRRAALIVAVTDSFRTRLVDRGIDGAKIRVVTNGADLTRFAPRPKDPELARQWGLEGKFVAGYIGTHGLAHGLETILDAAERLSGGAEADRCVLLFLGDGARKQWLQHETKRRALRNVRFLDSVGKEDVARYWSLLDVAIIHLKPDPLFRTVIPSKLFESMAMGIPILLGVEGESERLVRQHGVGLCFEPGNADALVVAMRRCLDHPQELADFRLACRDTAGSFDRRQLASAMLVLLQELDRAPAH